MECVGTLSWSGLGWDFSPKQSRKAREADSAQREARAAMQNSSEVWPQAGSGQVGSGVDARPAAVAPRQIQAEAKTLEVDWALTVRRCMAGDSGAWAELVRTYHRRVYGLCYRFTGNATDAEDLTQDVFLKIYSNLGSFDGSRGNLVVWITTMTRNLLVDNYRRTRNQRATGSLDEGWNESDELKPIDRLTSEAPSPHEMAAKKELARMVQDALAKVSTDLREAVILRDLQDMDYKEIAQVLGIPEGTVKSRISRGRAELARLLERNQREVV